MRYFLENLFSLHPQNLIPEAVWMGCGIYLLVVFACLHSILRFTNLRFPGKILWGAFIIVPFLGPLIYATYRLYTSDSTIREVLQSRGTNVE